ncbi:GMC family oxidoreductase N-terminal domain-containing protein [Taibaiella soli]|uniref:Cholesterol oxidase n=1 Tax=Taibaiella soli TaxID=1649169 RepID=A0A2W2BER7_9BACT|nr:GMC family oxidoreductase [Taibaiella soli]PZF74387.1 GMC family oxidoreductase [Taibaiella soli]
MNFQRLSSPVANMQNHYEVIVIGSGYGAGIAASRLSRAGKKVCLLEKGKEFLPGEYPSTTGDAMKEMQFNTPDGRIGPNNGLFEFHLNNDMSVYKGCGLGGTSLVNANVSLIPEPRVLEKDNWPEAIRKDPDSYWRNVDRARHMLQPNQYPEGKNGYPKLPKSEAMKLSAKGMGKDFRYLDINVTFENRRNNAGVDQYKCELCGDCMTGCNYGAKNTTLMNYLPDARNHGAEIYTGVGIQYISKNADGKWVVHYLIENAESNKFDAPDLFVTADMVIIGAGALGSTEIMLRSKEKGLTASDMVGERFTGNGDVLGFGYNCDVQVNTVGFGHHKVGEIPPVGPCITSVIDLREQPTLEDGMVIEDGNVPGPLASTITASMATISKIFGSEPAESLSEKMQRKLREAESLIRGPYHGAMNNTQAFLVMTHDDGKGKMVLEKDRLKILWPGVGKEGIFQKVDKNLRAATEAIGGEYVVNPTWTKVMDYDLITVHPLGGCIMGDDATKGAVNHKGEVFSGTTGTDVHKGLYVCDGSIVPLPLGVNPLITISALAERCCEIIAQDYGLTINYDYKDFAVQGETLKPGIQFTETMKGYFSTAEKSDFEKGKDLGRSAGSLFDFTLTVTSNDVETMLKDPQHQATLAGIVKAPVLSQSPLTITNGIFNLFVNADTEIPTKLMNYRMNIHSEEGKDYYFYGFKQIRDDKGFDLWKDTCTLYITVHEGTDEASPVLGKGILVIETADFAKQLTTMKVLNAASKMQELRVMTDFGKYFSGSLYDIYIKPHF